MSLAHATRTQGKVADSAAATGGHARARSSGEATQVTGVPLFLRSHTVVQRQEESGGAASPGLQLTPPSLLAPTDASARFYPDFGLRLQLDPELQARMRAMLAMRLDPSEVLPTVQTAAQFVGSGGAVPASSGAPTPSTPASTPAPAASGGSTSTAGTPAVPAAPGSTPEPRAGSPGDLLSAVVATAPVTRLLDGMKERALGDLDRYWSHASTGERVGFVTSSVVVGSAMLAPLLGFREPREFVLPLLNDKVIPIPGLPGYGLEFRFGERDVMVGAHLDLGTLILPQSWGFGPATFAPIGGPPAPVSRKADGEAGSSAPHAAAQVESSRGEGRALPEAVRAPLEAKLGSTFGDVRIHDDVRADRLSRTLAARAFTSGADIFFRAGEYDPHSPAGSRLLAHELVHTVQQARGEVAGESTPAGLRVSPANDAHEIEAERVANAVIR